MTNRKNEGGYDRNDPPEYRAFLRKLRKNMKPGKTHITIRHEMKERILRLAANGAQPAQVLKALIREEGREAVERIMDRIGIKRPTKAVKKAVRKALIEPLEETHEEVKPVLTLEQYLDWV